MGLPAIIIAILLAALLIGISTGFFGEVFEDQSANAAASKASNEAQQILESIEMYQARNGSKLPTNDSGELDVSKLVDQGYLKVMPKGWKTDASSIQKSSSESDISQDACLKVNESLGYSQESVPSCSSFEPDTKYYCCEE